MKTCVVTESDIIQYFILKIFPTLLIPNEVQKMNVYIYKTLFYNLLTNLRFSITNDKNTVLFYYKKMCPLSQAALLIDIVRYVQLKFVQPNSLTLNAKQINFCPTGIIVALF